MTLVNTLARAAGLGFCVVAFAGTALADPGNGNGNGNPPATPPGQEKKAEPAPAPATPTPAQQAAAPGQEKKAEKQEAKAEKKAKPKPAAKAADPAKAAKPAKPAKTSGSYKNTSSGNDLKKGVDGGHKHTICHATGSSTNPFVRITPSVSGVFHGHIGHQGDEDIIPPFVYKGTTYSQNWDAAGQALFNARCAAPASSTPLSPVTPSTQTTQQNTACPATTTTTERVLVGIKHYTGAVKNGQRKYVVISPSQKSAHMKGKHADDEPMYETRTVTRTVSGENCAAVTSSPNTTGTANTESTVQASQSAQASQSTQVGAVAGAQAPAAGVAGAVSPANTAAEQDKPAGGVLGAVTGAPEAIAKTATSGTLPFTGIPLWIAALIGGALLAAGLVLRRTA